MSGINEYVTREIEQFLYREARLLDERRFHEWLELLTDDGTALRRASGYVRRLCSAAAGVGALVLRGVSAVAAGEPPAIKFEHNGRRHPIPRLQGGIRGGGHGCGGR